MPRTRLTAELKCANCGSSDIVLPDDPTDESLAVCQNCGTVFGTWGWIKDQVKRTIEGEGAAEYRKTLKDFARKSKTIKLKD